MNDPYPSYRCTECTLMRCCAPGLVCWECKQHARETFDAAQQAAVKPAGWSYAPYDWSRFAP